MIKTIKYLPHSLNDELLSIIKDTTRAHQGLQETMDNIRSKFNARSFPNGIMRGNHESARHEYTHMDGAPFTVGKWFPIGIQRVNMYPYSYKPFGNYVLDFDPDLGEFIWYDLAQWRDNPFGPKYPFKDKYGKQIEILRQYIPMGMELEVQARNMNMRQCEDCANYDYDNNDSLQTFCDDPDYCYDERGSSDLNNGFNFQTASFRFLAEINASFGGVGIRNKPIWIAKQDSSVDLEFVSAPMTIRAYRAGFAINNELFNSFEFYRAYSKGYYGPCGGHIHMDKHIMESFNYYAFLSMHYENPDLIADIAQRPIDENSSWCYMQKPDSIAKVAKDKDGTNHRGALHHTHQTLELRYFRSNLKTERLMKNIEWVQSLYRFASELSFQDMSRDNGHRFKFYVMYLKAHRNKYPNLFKYLKVKGWLRDKTDSFDDYMDEVGDV